MEDPFAQVRSGGPVPRKPKKSGRLARSAVTIAVVGGGMAYYRHVEATNARDEVSGIAVDLCWEQLVRARGGRDSPYVEARRSLRSEDYVQCVALETCIRTPVEPVTYFFALLARPNSCGRAERKYQSRFQPGLPDGREPSVSDDPGTMLGLTGCFEALTDRERDALMTRIGTRSDAWYAARHDVELATVRQDRGRAARKVKACLDPGD